MTLHLRLSHWSGSRDELAPAWASGMDRLLWCEVALWFLGVMVAEIGLSVLGTGSGAECYLSCQLCELVWVLWSG